MDKKKRKTFSLDADLVDWLGGGDLNASSIVNSLLEEYRHHGKTREAAVEKRLHDLEDKLDDARRQKQRAESKIDQLERQRDDVAARLRDLRTERHDAVLEVAALIRSDDQPVTRADLTPDHDLVTGRCEGADLTPQRFLQELDRELMGTNA